MKRISEVITPEEIKQWKNTDIITISAGTGAGKSHFIKNRLFVFAKENNKKILMLIHRRNCVNQFQKEIEREGKTDTIDIKTYQSLESMKHYHKVEFDFSQYAYIVCDEFHYFLSDAAFNITTDISLDLILSNTNITRIFMSATGDDMKRYLNKIKSLQTIDYGLPVDYKFIKELAFFNKDETMEQFVDKLISMNIKAIFFIQSATKAYDLYKKYKDVSLFNCSKSDKHYKYVIKEKINDMLVNERFEELILITTTCLDSGVNIKDVNVQLIVIDVEDVGVLIQCLGRRRILSKTDKIFVYIKAINNQQLGSRKARINNKIEMAEYRLNHTNKEFIQKYPRQNDYSNIVYDSIVDEDDKGTKKINELMYFKSKLDLGYIAIMLEYGKYGYCKYLKELLGYDKNYGLPDEDYKKDELETYFQSILGKVMLQVRDRKDLIDKINVRSNGRQLKKLHNLNGALEEMQIPYRIIEFQTSRIINGKKKNYKNAWKVDKLISNNLPTKMGDKL